MKGKNALSVSIQGDVCIKVLHPEDPAVAWAHRCMRRSYREDWMPVVYSVSYGRYGVMVEMEALQEVQLNRHLPSLEASKLIVSAYSNPKVLDTPEGAALDLCIDNIMMRGEQAVLIDPWYTPKRRYRI